MSEFPVDSEPDLDTIVESFASACRRGERPEIGTWLDRYPVFASELNELLPAVMLLEKDGPTEAGPGAHRSPVFPEIPKRIGDYRLLREIGRGGMGVVCEAVEEPLGRRVALKILPALHLAGAEERARFQREAEVASRLDHPGICTVYRAGVESGVPFLAMRLVEGETLAQILRRARDEDRPPRSREEIALVLRLAEGVARALHHAHEAGVVHRDIKPQNIMVDPRGEPVILDFGLARDLGGDLTLTRTGALCGTPAYLAPEALRAGKAVPAPAADIYALGATLFEALTLRRPFEAPTLDALYHAVLHDEPPDARRLNPSLGRDVHAVLATALAKEPARRYGGVQAFAGDLRALIDGRPVSVRPPSLAGRLARWARREPAKALLAGALAVLLPLLAGLGGFLAANLPEIRRGEREASRDRVEAALETGFIEMSGGGDTAALAAFRTALREDPQCAEALAGAVLTHLYSAQVQEGLALLDAHRSLEADAPALGLLRVTALRNLGRAGEAARAASAVPEPDSAFAWFLSGMTALDTLERDDRERMRRATDHLQRAVRLCRVARPYYLGALAYAASISGDREIADETSAAVLELWPRRAGSWYWRALVLEPVDALAAEAALRRTLELDPSLTRAMDLLGSILSRLDRHEEAVAFHRKVHERQPLSSRAAYNLVVTLRAAGSGDEALETCRRAVELLPGDASLRRLLGSQLWQTQDLEGALASYRRATELDPGTSANWSALGAFLAESGRHEEAAAAWARAVACNPFSAEAHHGLGKACFHLEEDSEAIAAFREAVRIDPARSKAYEYLVAACYRLGRKGEALDVARQAFRLAPRDPAVYAKIRGLLDQDGRLDEILEVERRRAEVYPGDAEVAVGVGDALLDLHRFEEAAAEYSRVLESDPGHAEAHGRLGEALRQLGRFGDAVEALRKGQELMSRQPGGERSAASGLARAENLLRISRNFRGAGAGDPPPDDPRRLLQLAWVALVIGDAPLARRLLAGMPEDELRAEGGSQAADAGYLMALAAIAVATSKSADGPGDGMERSVLRREAWRFLRDRLDEDRQPAGAPVPVEIRRRWLSWLHDPRLASVRDAGALAVFTEEESRRWGLLWEDARRFVSGP